MATFERATTVDAPFERNWAFHSTVDGLRAVTPDVAGLRVHEIAWTGGSPDDTLTEGTRITLSLSPFGIGPLVSWTSEIVKRRENADDETAVMVDEVVAGPIATWRHEHHVRAVDGGSEIRDRVTIATGLGSLVDRLVAAGLAPLFWDRHRRTRAVLSGD